MNGKGLCVYAQCIFIFACTNFTEVLTFNALNSLRQFRMSSPVEIVVWPQQLQVTANIIQIIQQMLFTLLKTCLNTE